jgi:hypothetical protein
MGHDRRVGARLASAATGWSSWLATAAQAPPEGLGGRIEELELAGTTSQWPALYMYMLTYQVETNLSMKTMETSI